MEKRLTIREVLIEKEKLQNKLQLYLDKKKINYYKTQPSSPVLRDIVSGKSNSMAVFDSFSHFAIQDEQYDEIIYELQETINSYDRFLINEMKRLSKLEPIKLKVYLLREDECFIQSQGRKRTWLEIAEITNYSDRQVRRIYEEIVS